MILSSCQNYVPLFRVGLQAKILFIRCLMPDSGHQIPDLGIARAAQALAPRVALSFHIRAKIIVCNLNPEPLVCLKWNDLLKIAIMYFLAKVQAHPYDTRSSALDRYCGPCTYNTRHHPVQACYKSRPDPN